MKSVFTEVFETAFRYVLENEGRTFVNDPHDSGGATKFGITLKNYQAFLGTPVDLHDMENLDEDLAKLFYFEKYWKSLSCDRMSKPSIAIAIFDCGVLYGVATSAIMAQKTASLCGASLKFDGLIGDKSLAALNMVEEEKFLTLFHGFVLTRIDAIMHVHPKNERFRDGWTNRADKLLSLKGLVA